MQSESTFNSKAARVLSSLSITSGALLLCAPQTMAQLCGLPHDRRMCRVLGARDVAIGVLLRRPGSAKLGMWLRAGSDAFDLTVRHRTMRGAPAAGPDHRKTMAGALALMAISVGASVDGMLARRRGQHEADPAAT